MTCRKSLARFWSSVSEEWPIREHNTLLMVCFACVFVCLRRFSLVENARHFCHRPTEEGGTPSDWSDEVLIVELVYIGVLTGLVAIFVRPEITSAKNANTIEIGWPSFLVTLVIFLHAIQIVQAGLYYSIWRWVTKLRNRLTPYSHARNLFIGIIAYFKLTWLFGLIYWISCRQQFNIELDSLPQALYFSCVTATTVGFGDITPASDSFGLVNIFIVSQIILSFLSGVLVLARAVGLLGDLPEQASRRPETKKVIRPMNPLRKTRHRLAARNARIR